MSVKFKVGDQVKQVLPPPIRGEVKRLAFDETTGGISYVIADSTGHESVLHENNVEAA